MEIHKMDISIPYYEDVTRISNSNIGWFLNKGPSFLHKMLSGEGEELDLPQLKRGTMIHEYLLQQIFLLSFCQVCRSQEQRFATSNCLSSHFR